MAMELSDDAFPLDEELKLALTKAAALMRENPLKGEGLNAIRRQMQAVGRWWNEGGETLAAEQAVQVPTSSGFLDAVLYRPSNTARLPVYAYLHGGGFKFGDASANAYQLRAIARRWGGAVLSLNYPHIPEEPFPAAVEAVGSAYLWLHEHGWQFGLDGSRIAFGGSSAGANVSCGASVAIGGARSNSFLRAAALIVPVFDGTITTPSMERFADGPHFPTRGNAQQTWRDYLIDLKHDSDPRANLMVADPALFPPVFIAAAQIDVFRDGAELMAERLADAGQVVDHRVYAGMTHLFFGYARMVATARRCAEDIATFLEQYVPVAASGGE